MATKTPAPWAAANIAEPAAPETEPVAAVDSESGAPTPAVTPDAEPQAPAIAPQQQEPATDEMVIVTVPKAFVLRIDNDTVRELRAGVQKLEKSLADHWYAQANGVTTFEG